MCYDFNPNEIDRRFKGNYSKEELNDKYRFQHRWQEKNGYIVKTFRINETTKRELLEFAEDNGKSSATVLLEAFKDYKTEIKRKNNAINDFLESISPCEKKKRTKLFQDKKCSDKKNFKIKKVFADELDAACKESGYSYGYFITKILDEHMAKANKAKNNSTDE